MSGGPTSARTTASTPRRRHTSVLALYRRTISSRSPWVFKLLVDPTRAKLLRLADAHVRMLLDPTREHMTHEPAPEHGPEHVAPGIRIEPARASAQRSGRSGAKA